MFIIIACDGIWDCLTNEICVNRLATKIQELKVTENGQLDLCKPIEEMFNENLAKNLMSNDNKGTDNMTAIIIYFHDNLKLFNE